PTAGRPPAGVAAAAYAATPAGRDAIGRGDIGPLVLFALAPFALHVLIRATADNERDRRSALHSVLAVGLFGAIATAAWPPAILFPVLVAAAFALSTLFALGDWSPLRAAALALLGAAVSVVLVSPWIWSLLGADPATQARRARVPRSLGDLLRFDTGPARSGWYTLGLVVIAFVPLVIATGPRLVWATRMWLLTLLSFLLAWLPARVSVTGAVRAPEGVLVPAAIGLAVAAGLGVSALLDDMRRSHFGWRQVSAVAAVVGLTLPVLALAADTVSGRWQLPSTDWPTAV